MKPTPLTPRMRVIAENVKYGGEVFMLIPLPPSPNEPEAWALMDGRRKILGYYTGEVKLSDLEAPVVAPARVQPNLYPPRPSHPNYGGIDVGDIEI